MFKFLDEYYDSLRREKNNEDEDKQAAGHTTGATSLGHERDQRYWWQAFFCFEFMAEFLVSCVHSVGEPSTCHQHNL